MSEQTGGRPEPARRLGAAGPGVFPVGLGCMGMSEFYGARDRGEAERAIGRALELGVTLFDTADIYGLGENERLLGRALGGRRREATIATKFGLVRDASGAFTGVDGSAAYARSACEASLRRLGLDGIDLLQLHRVDPDTPIEETVGAMSELVAAGKVRHIGLPEVTAEQLRRAAAEATIATVQGEYSLLERSVERELLPACRELGISLMAYAPFMRGLIARRFTSVEELDDTDTRRRGRYPRLSGEALEANLRLAGSVWEIADSRSIPPSQIALAWLLAQGESVIPIPGAKTVQHVEQNAAAAGLNLSDAELRKLDGIVGVAGSAEGERLPGREAGTPTG